MRVKNWNAFGLTLVLLAVLTACDSKEPAVPIEEPSAADSTDSASAVVSKTALTDEQVKDIVRRSYQYVAMYNVNNKFALKEGGWNRCVADTTLKDHTMKDIARPNNDTLYITCLLDLRKDPMILDVPAFDSTYVSLMVTGYDHYVNVPLSVTKGDFKEHEKVLFYTARTEGFTGEAVEGVDRNFEMTGDFVSAVFRVMPHASDPERFEKIIDAMESVKVQSLSELMGKAAKPIDDIHFPDVGVTDVDIYDTNLAEVLQFVVNHTSFDLGNVVDTGFLAAIKPLGIEPGNVVNPEQVAKIDGARFKAAAEAMRSHEFALTQDPEQMAKFGLALFKTKGNIGLDALLLQSVIGPIGLPATEAIYPPLVTENGQPMNALNDYVIHMEKDGLPPAKAFWSVTLYDSVNGFFIPNQKKKYSVGENAGMQLNADGGIDIYIAAEKPEGVPDVNWLPINRNDESLDAILRIYVPDLVAYKNYTVPKIKQLNHP